MAVVNFEEKSEDDRYSWEGHSLLLLIGLRTISYQVKLAKC